MSEILLIDVRTPDEFAEGHMEGAINIPIQNIMSGDLGVIQSASKDTRIECYCASGARSEMAKGILEKYDYKNVTNIGGFR